METQIKQCALCNSAPEHYRHPDGVQCELRCCQQDPRSISVCYYSGNLNGDGWLSAVERWNQAQEQLKAEDALKQLPSDIETLLARTPKRIEPVTEEEVAQRKKTKALAEFLDMSGLACGALLGSAVECIVDAAELETESQVELLERAKLYVDTWIELLNKLQDENASENRE